MALERIDFRMIDEIINFSDSHSYIETGCREIDKSVGGLHKGETYLLSGCPAEGKTAFAINLVNKIGVFQRKTVAHFSLVENRDDVVNRLIRNVSALKLITIENKTEIEKIKYLINKADVYINTIPVVDVAEIRDECSDIVRILSLVVIDDIQELRAWRSNDEGLIYEQLDELKKLALELNCPIIIIDSLNGIKDWDNYHNHLSNLRFPNIKSHVDNIWFIERKPKKGGGSKGSDEVELIVAQNKHGIKCRIPLVYLPENMTFCSFDNPTKWEKFEGYQFKEVIL